MIISDFEQQVLDDIFVYSMQRSIILAPGIAAEYFDEFCWWKDNVILVKDATKYNEVVSKYWASKGVGV